MIIVLILGVVSINLQMPYLKELTKQSIMKAGNVDAAQAEQMLGLTSAMSYVGVTVGTIFMIFFVALLLVLLNLVVRGEGKYLQFVNVAAFANLPTIIGSLLTAVLLVVMDAHSLSDVTLSLGALVEDKTGTMYRVLSLINPFTIWGLYLYIVGTATMMKCSRKKIAIWIVVVWLIYSFITVFSAPTV